MTAKIITPTDGRGAWPSSGLGGTLRSDGQASGRFYRSVGKGVTLKPIGTPGYQADRSWTECTLDEYAVWRATMAIQAELKERGLHAGTIDGIWGPATDSAVKALQNILNLAADGVYGPATSKALWKPRVVEACKTVDPNSPDLVTIAMGTISLESNWDPGAVGSDTNDLGLGQINGLAHPTMSINDRLNPKLALPYVARLIANNLKAMNSNTRDGIAAYNLGVTGARNWIAAGRPDIWNGRNVKSYIDKILALGRA